MFELKKNYISEMRNFQLSYMYVYESEREREREKLNKTTHPCLIIIPGLLSDVNSPHIRDQTQIVHHMKQVTLSVYMVYPEEIPMDLELEEGGRTPALQSSIYLEDSSACIPCFLGMVITPISS